ncbi:hypothetical protein D623_10024194 [Myotis brandtii]|uniref:Uncharacterized protein n=1 Tax=Myotis brandtii TaxID=109478 RepID=S7NF76_MYOBR|nr:hypothetical protein D623_10024194 [Myotis brandtii]
MGDGWAGSGLYSPGPVRDACPHCQVQAQPFHASLGCVSALVAPRTEGGTPRNSQWPLTWSDTGRALPRPQCRPLWKVALGAVSAGQVRAQVRLDCPQAWLLGKVSGGQDNPPMGPEVESNSELGTLLTACWLNTTGEAANLWFLSWLSQRPEQGSVRP